MDLSALWGFGILIAVVVAIALMVRKGSRALKQASEKAEAMFRASFPELQPHFHPARVHEFVKARRSRGPSSGPHEWKSPPGFPAAATARIEHDGEREKVTLVDAAGARLASFVFEVLPEGGSLRVGKGKLTATLTGPEPRVRYWHPDREFKWTPRAWKFQSRVAEHAVESSYDDNYSTSIDTTTIGRAAAVGGIVAAGSALADGDHSSDGSAPDFSSVQSESSSTATAY